MPISEMIPGNSDFSTGDGQPSAMLLAFGKRLGPHVVGVEDVAVDAESAGGYGDCPAAGGCSLDFSRPVVDGLANLLGLWNTPNMTRAVTGVCAAVPLALALMGSRNGNV